LRADDRELAAVAALALKEATDMQDQIIDAVMAHSIHTDAVRTHPLAAWVIVRDQVDYPGDLVACLVTDVLTPYVLLADTLGACTPNCRLAWSARSGSRLTRQKL